MKKKDEIILEIADVNFPNKAYGYYEGEKVIVKNAVPGQKVQAQVFKKRGSGVEARLQEVIERSPMERETGMCSHYAPSRSPSFQAIRGPPCSDCSCMIDAVLPDLSVSKHVVLYGFVNLRTAMMLWTFLSPLLSNFLLSLGWLTT